MKLESDTWGMVLIIFQMENITFYELKKEECRSWLEDN
jgi:hypothetical protein